MARHSLSGTGAVERLRIDGSRSTGTSLYSESPKLPKDKRDVGAIYLVILRLFQLLSIDAIDAMRSDP